MLVVSRKEVEENLKMNECIEVMEDTLKALAKGQATQILRTSINIYEDNIFGIMPSYIETQKIVGTKAITIFPKNYKEKKPSHQGAVLVFETNNGSLKAIVDGEGITAVRTAAVSAVATRALAKEDCKILGILGAGVQARSHLEAMLLVRDIETVNVWSIFYDEAVNFAKEMSEKFDMEIIPCKEVADTVKNADIICTVTAAKTPILFGKWLKPGVHINAVGACTPRDREIDTDVVVKSKLFVDRKESTVNESGDYLIPLKEGAITEKHILGEVGDILIGKLKGREFDDEITLFEALGLAIEDLAAANYVIDEIAKKHNVEKLQMGGKDIG